MRVFVERWKESPELRRARLISQGYRIYFTVDVPHVTLWLKPSEINPRALFDDTGVCYDRWMVRPL